MNPVLETCARRLLPALLTVLLMSPVASAQSVSRTFEAGWSVWIADDGLPTLQCFEPGTLFYRTCSDNLVLARYGGNFEGRTYIAMDFDTRCLPDDAIIEQ